MSMKVGLEGFGNVGRELAKRLGGGVIRGVQLVAGSARDVGEAEAAAKALSPVLRVVPMADLPGVCDVIVECATADSFPEIARTVLGAGKMLICVSAGGVPSCPEL